MRTSFLFRALCRVSSDLGCQSSRHTLLSGHDVVVHRHKHRLASRSWCISAWYLSISFLVGVSGHNLHTKELVSGYE
jgi:hypothetical protein